ncbi:hypothetical protein BO82DRAFT_357535 [Aspergillus uvarum CBS 121591]|uniref:Uncharacterized protein n=1 Tax=Aspergillus uvarum CBS 121591 TaxID=1448315 RepID=A0A319C361_9EURO|nr:hypothetical protein BO82DRAFT_357535 [Aspergillus uvarum CBS 121591]PYH78290.1 hypothetical protein BO82DRAFT_357535 [Aspergillus uvarum CBS 121591]
MVFTIVTIVFLPLSFLTSLFALNIAVFPESPYPNQWIFPILFGCSAAFSIPATVVALNVNELVMKPYYRWRLSSRPKRDPWEGRHRRKETKDSDKADNLPVESVPRGGGILSIATALQRMSPSGGSFVARRLRNKKLEGSEGRDWDTSVC